MEAKNSLLTQILQCWYLDLKFLIDLIETYELDLDVEDILFNYWYTNIKDFNINILIYESFEQIKNQFLEENKEEIENKLNLNIYDIEYEIYTNYLDSHLWFTKNDELNQLFDEYKK